MKGPASPSQPLECATNAFMPGATVVWGGLSHSMTSLPGLAQSSRKGNQDGSERWRGGPSVSGAPFCFVFLPEMISWGSHRGEPQENQGSHTHRSCRQEARMPHGATWENASAARRQALGQRLPGPRPSLRFLRAMQGRGTVQAGPRLHGCSPIAGRLALRRGRGGMWPPGCGSWWRRPGSGGTMPGSRLGICGVWAQQGLECRRAGPLLALSTS